jgi:hypothetical protein
MPGQYHNELYVDKVVDLGHIEIFNKASCVVIIEDKPFKIIVDGRRTLGNRLYKCTQFSKDLDFTSRQIHSLDGSSKIDQSP